jgi:hypothetical protein
MPEKTPLLALMCPNREQLHRTFANDVSQPKAFAWPIIQAGFDVRFLSGDARIIRRVASFVHQEEIPCLLIFTLSLREFIAAMMFRRRLRICSLFQWIPMEMVPAHKRICYRLVLANSRVIAVYNSIAEDYIRQRFPRATVVRIGLFVDSDYFKPDAGRKAEGDSGFLLCPGSHRRDEGLAIQIARETGMRLVRFSQDASAQRYYGEHKPAMARLESNVSFERTRDLYARAAAVINVVDDSQIPAGLTCCCEALAMNFPVITPAGHSSAGYEFADGYKPYVQIANPADCSAWTGAVRSVLSQRGNWPPGRSPRDLALQMCSAERSIRDWRRIRQHLTG